MKTGFFRSKSMFLRKQSMFLRTIIIPSQDTFVQLKFIQFKLNTKQMTHTIKCFQITISGKLRDRGLRFSATYMAYQLNVTGFVEYNHASGILIEAEGEAEQLEQFVAWLRTFVQSWKVSDIIITETAPNGYSAFKIRNNPTGEDTPSHHSYAIKYLSSFFRKIPLMFGSEKHRIFQNK